MHGLTSLLRSSRPTLRSTVFASSDDVWSYTSLLNALHDDGIRNAVILPDAILRATDQTGSVHSVQLIPMQVASVADDFVSHGVDIQFAGPNALLLLVREATGVLPYILLGLLMYNLFVSRGMSSGLPGNPATSMALNQNVDTRFADVAGLTTAKEELFEVVQYLRDPTRFHSSGARCPRGVLLEGPPGTGKTLLARAVAGEATCAFLPVTASSFVEMYVGLGASRVRSLFSKAREAAPCVLWIDEIDAVAKRRSAGGGGVSNGNDERETTLNELLSAMDGFSRDTGVVVLAATNRADSLDEALLRPGRFDRRIAVTLPTTTEREAILQIHSRNKTVDSSVCLAEVASQTAGFSGAALENLMNEAAIRAMRRNDTVIGRGDVAEALDRIVAGLPRSSPPSKATRERVAVHEAGHTVVASFMNAYDRIARVTIVPRTSGTGGFTNFVPDEDRTVDGLYTKDYCLARLTVLLGGRAAENIILGPDTVSVGASGDLERVQELARRMVTEWGMGDSLVAYDSARVGLSTRDAIDEEIDTLVEQAYSRAYALLNARVAELNTVSRLLIARDTISGDDVKECLASVRDTRQENINRRFKS